MAYDEQSEATAEEEVWLWMKGPPAICLGISLIILQYQVAAPLA